MQHDEPRPALRSRGVAGRGQPGPLEHASRVVRRRRAPGRGARQPSITGEGRRCNPTRGCNNTLCTRGGDPTRQPPPPNPVLQLREAAALIEREARQHGCVGALLMGDMNWGDKPEDGDPLHTLGAGWVDAWEAVGRPKAAKVTCGWSFRLDRCFVLSLGRDAGGRALGTSGGGPPADGGGGSGGDGLAVRVAGVTLVGGESIAGEFYEHVNQNGQSKCASSSQCAPAIVIAPSLSIERGWTGGRERARVAAHIPPRPTHYARAFTGGSRCLPQTTRACSCSSRRAAPAEVRRAHLVKEKLLKLERPRCSWCSRSRESQVKSKEQLLK
jgi:hypothetical protein